ncbi:hypothetical protein Q428_09665 [Fervidicella metallireducens AeB]|uniref:DUF5317 domain-containing protein n=1 Tax=Fervidicella metallireducens AeB TaxID=1403537 RepID=A0A017RW52_9CLOT|nr:DUF5317 domain-containing protein [Fervidicella metallireducens]EYE88140.1 hypothetical protein Q428_09665 [Fervidicella metallireducens AeB]
MFIEALVLSIILGIILKGSLANLGNLKLDKIYLILISFAIEFLMMILITKGIISRGVYTYFFNFVMYLLLLTFVYYNRSNFTIIIMGIGFILNALPIFLNGGAMPVSPKAVYLAGLAPSVSAVKVSTEGLYVLQNAQTKLWFLGDIIPKPFLRPAVISIGDIVIALGLILLIIKGMRKSLK